MAAAHAYYGRRIVSVAALCADHLVHREFLDVWWTLRLDPAAAISSTIRGAKASKSARDSQKSMIPQPPSIGPEA